jgi:hypothetical protein
MGENIIFHKATPNWSEKCAMISQPGTRGGGIVENDTFPSPLGMRANMDSGRLGTWGGRHTSSLSRPAFVSQGATCGQVFRRSHYSWGPVQGCAPLTCQLLSPGSASPLGCAHDSS